MFLHLGGHLAWYDPQKRSRLEIQLRAPIALIDLLDQLGVPSAEIAVAAINGNLVSLDDARVANDDRIDLYPPVGGGMFQTQTV